MEYDRWPLIGGFCKYIPRERNGMFMPLTHVFFIFGTNAMEFNDFSDYV